MRIVSKSCQTNLPQQRQRNGHGRITGKYPWKYPWRQRIMPARPPALPARPPRFPDRPPRSWGPVGNFGSGILVPGFQFRDSGSGIPVPGFRFRDFGSGILVPGFRFRDSVPARTPRFPDRLPRSCRPVEKSGGLAGGCPLGAMTSGVPKKYIFANLGVPSHGPHSIL